MGLLDTKHVVQLLVRPVREGAELWSWGVWRGLARELSPWVRSPELVEVRSHQRLRDPPTEVAFPTLRWSDTDAQRWTHRSPITMRSSGSWLFESTNVMAPAWSQCVQTSASPSLYVEVKSRPLGALAVECLLISIASDLAAAPDIRETMREHLLDLKGGDPRALLVHTTRPFVHRDRMGLVRAIDEITHNELDRELSFESLQRGSLAMDRRCRVVTEPWQRLDV